MYNSLKTFPTKDKAWQIYLEAEKDIDYRLHQRTCFLKSQKENTDYFWGILVQEWKEAFEAELRSMIAHFDEVLSKNPENYYAIFKKNCYLEVLGEDQ